MDIDGVDDREYYNKTKKAMTIVGIAEEKQKEIFKLLASILHLGNWKKGKHVALDIIVLERYNNILQQVAQTHLCKMHVPYLVLT